MSLRHFSRDSLYAVTHGRTPYHFWMGLLSLSMLIGAYGYYVQFTEGLAVTGMNDHVSWGLYILRFVDRRADLLKTTELLESAALDPYAFMREAYLQRRQNQVYDGNPPLEDIFGDEPGQ